MRATRRLVEWGNTLRLRTQLALCAGLGACAALGQAPVGAWPVTVIALALLFGMCRSSFDWRHAMWRGWAAGTGYFMLALSWIVEPFLVDVARHGWMAPFAIVLLSGGLALFWAGSFAIVRRLEGRTRAWMAVFILAEALRGYVLTGFPWAQIGHVWIDTPMLHWASVGGSLALSGIILWSGSGLWHLINGRRKLGAAMISVVVVLFALGWALTPESSAASADAPTVRLIQPNAPQHEKWDPDKVQMFFDRQVAFSGDGDERPDLIVWPETAIPVLLNNAEPALQVISSAAGDVPVVLGAQRLDGSRLFNSMIMLDEHGQVVSLYDKHHLVPFGEYVPLGDYLKQIGIRGMAARDGNGFSPGPGTQIMRIGDLGRALPLICYEGVFPADIATAPERADFLLLITNDAWFGQVSGPYQHLAQARLRSAEQGLPMIRVANTGVSAMIDGAGRVTAQIPLGQAGWLDAPLPPPLPPTIYARTGDWLVFLVTILVLASLLLRNPKNIRAVSD